MTSRGFLGSVPRVGRCACRCLYLCSYLSLCLLATAARAEEQEARWRASPLAGLALVSEAQASPAFALAKGASVALTYGWSNELDLGAELIALAAEPTFDAALPIEGVVIEAPFKRRTSSAWLLLGPTWRFGAPYRWTPVVGAAIGGGLRYRSIGFFSELGEMPSGKDPALTVDVAASGRVGIEHRLDRRLTIGAYGALLAAWGAESSFLPITTLSLGISYVHYPRW